MSTFNMKKQPWFIKLERLTTPEREAVRKFIAGKMGGCPHYNGARYYTNYCMGAKGSPADTVYVGDNLVVKDPVTEIKLSFALAVVEDSVVYPNPVPKETATQRQLKQLEATIKEAQEQIEALKRAQAVQ